VSREVDTDVFSVVVTSGLRQQRRRELLARPEIARTIRQPNVVVSVEFRVSIGVVVTQPPTKLVPRAKKLGIIERRASVLAVARRVKGQVDIVREVRRRAHPGVDAPCALQRINAFATSLHVYDPFAIALWHRRPLVVESAQL
jgi:hypothetical protein